MPSLLTELEIWNLALDVVRETPLQSPTDQSAIARWLSRNYGHVRDVALRSYDWNFAREKHTLSVDATAPPFRWRYRYALPPHWLRLLPPTQYGQRGAPPIPHEVVRGGWVETDWPSPLHVRLIMRVTNPGEYDPLFVELVRSSLALGIANKFTAKNKYIELASALQAAAQEKAEEIDTFEGTAEPVEQHDIIRNRGV